jgi:hypothetical protein
MAGTGSTYNWTDRLIGQRANPIGSESEITISRIITRLDGAVMNSNAEYEAMITDGALPIIDYDPWTGGGSWHDLALARSTQINVLESGKAVEAQIRFSTYYVISPLSTETEILMLPAMTSYVTASRHMKFHRTNWTVNPPTTSINVSATDIGGTSTTGAEGFESFQIGQVRVRLRAMQDASVTPMDSAAAALLSYNNATNNDTFLGFAAYSLVCEGVSLEKLDGTEFYWVIFEFLYDKFYHFSQVATIDADGRPRMTTGGALSEVKWQRIPRTATAFNNIYAGDTHLKALVENGWWISP